MPYRIIKGNLLEADTQYIVQQNNCTAVKTHVLSDTIAKKWPSINPYSSRKPYIRNWSIKEDRSTPGTIELYEFELPLITGLKGVICAFAQYVHGKSGSYIDPLHLNVPDSPADRVRYFRPLNIENGQIGPAKRVHHMLFFKILRAAANETLMFVGLKNV